MTTAASPSTRTTRPLLEADKITAHHIHVLSGFNATSHLRILVDSLVKPKTIILFSEQKGLSAHHAFEATCALGTREMAEILSNLVVF